MSTNSQPIPQGLGKYKLRECLGRGGMAEVWKAFDTELERYVAVKLLHADLQTNPEFITRFTCEARAIASLHHPNIIQIHDFQILQSPELRSPTAYMVMNYVEGQTLAHYIHSTSHIGKFPPSNDIIRIFRSLSQAVDYAHQHGMIHCDIKPANILLDQRNTKNNPMGEPILTDFGIAKIWGVSSGTMNGMWMGTPLYTSPEQVYGQPASERSDIYSLGVILYEMCTGVLPFRGENVNAIIMQHTNAMPLPPVLSNPNIPPALSLVILRCLAKDPAMRFSSASSMAAELADAFQTDEKNVDELYRPTYISPLSVQPAQSASQSNPEVSAPPIGAQADCITPIPTTPGDSPFANSQNPQATTPSQAPSSTSLLRLWRPRRGLLVTLIAMIIIVLLSSGLGAFYWLTHTRTVPIVGHAFFVSSGETSWSSTQGINDELRIDLYNIPDPAPGKSYYGWLLGDENQPLAPPISLGQLSVTNGEVHSRYQDNVHHTNLLESTSRFLITEGDTNISPVSPSSDKSTWRYFDELPQIANEKDMMHQSALDHFRHLLANAPSLKAVGLSGGLDTWLFRNTEKVFEWAGSARDFWDRQDATGIYNQDIRVLDYLDGVTNVQMDVPAGTQIMVSPHYDRIALLGSSDPMNMDASGYLYQISMHLSAITQAPSVSKEKQALAAQIGQAINNVKYWLGQVHTIAKQFVNMPTAQLLTPASLLLLDRMEALARYAYIGQLNPNTNQVLEGVVQIHYNIQRLATFDVAPYQSY